MTYTLFLTHWMVGWFNSSSNEWGLSLTKRETRNRQKNVINDSIKFLLHLPNTLHHHLLNRELRWKVLKLLFSHISFFDTFYIPIKWRHFDLFCEFYWIFCISFAQHQLFFCSSNIARLLQVMTKKIVCQLRECTFWIGKIYSARETFYMILPVDYYT